MQTINLLVKGKQSIRTLVIVTLGLYLVLNTSLVLAEHHVSAKSHHVSIQNFKFIPETLLVSIGDTVTWTNKDYFTHNIENITPYVKASKNLQKGESYSLKVTEAFYYICGLHPSMKGQISLRKKSK